MTLDVPSGAESPGSVAERAVEGLREVGHEVVRILDAHGVANEVVLDADLEALLGRQLVEAHDRGLLDEALPPAERRGDIGDRARVDYPRGGIQVAAHFERHD